MNSLLKNIGLYDQSYIEVNTARTELVQNLWKITYKTNTTFISLIRDPAIPTRFEYRGKIEENSFTIKTRRRFFDINMNYPVIKGSLHDQNNITIVSIEYIPTLFQIFTFILLLCFFLFAVAVNIKNSGEDFVFIGISSIMALSHYFVLKREITRGKYDFEKVIGNITQKHFSVTH